MCYVRFHNELDSAPRGKIYALILPHADGTCNEVARRTSEIAGIGLFPIGWETLAFPVAMAYLGVHTVVRDQRTSDIFVHVSEFRSNRHISFIYFVFLEYQEFLPPYK